MQSLTMIAYLLLFISSTLTILYNNKSCCFINKEESVIKLNISKIGVEDESIPPVAIWTAIQHFSERISLYLDTLRFRFEAHLINSTSYQSDKLVNFVYLFRSAAPFYPLISYIISCYLIIRQNRHGALMETSIWILSIALIFLNYDRYDLEIFISSLVMKLSFRFHFKYVNR